MALSSKFFPESTGEKNENWSIFSEDMEKIQSITFLAHPVYPAAG